MAIARIFDAPWTLDQYDQLIKTVDERNGYNGRAWPGNLFHWAAATSDGVRAVDCYESREAGDMLAGQIGQAAGELGLAPPQISEYEVHEFLTPV